MTMLKQYLFRWVIKVPPIPFHHVLPYFRTNKLYLFPLCLRVRLKNADALLSAIKVT